MDDAYQELVDAIVDGVANKLIRKPAPVELQYFTIAQAGQFTGFTEKALRDKITLGIGPKTFKIGRSIRIKREDLIAWAEGGAE